MSFGDEQAAGVPGSRKPTQEDQVLGRQLKDARKRAGRNQEWLARELGITYQQLGKYERGESSLKVWMLAKASRLLGVSPAALIEPIVTPGFAEPSADYRPDGRSDEDEFRQAFERAAALWPEIKKRRARR